MLGHIKMDKKQEKYDSFKRIDKICEYCGEEFRYQINLTAHEEICSGEKIKRKMNK